MTLDQIANIAEIFGMIVVAITLIFLTAQMRENTRATKSATASATAELTATWYYDIGNNP
jgi:protein-S-isoprenylcysteine O-methyltransferase Ste14